MLIGLFAAVATIYYIHETEKVDINSLNTNLHYKLVSLFEKENIKTPQYLYLEPDIINFFYDIRDFRVYNRDSYIGAIKSVDSLLKIKLDLENNYKYVKIPKLEPQQKFGISAKPKVRNNITNFKSNFETAEVLAFRSINYIHSFAISLPVGVYSEKHERALEIFHLLIKRILDEILHVCKRSTNDPLIGQDYGLPKPNKINRDLADSFDFV
jgi:hypothetical protein